MRTQEYIGPWESLKSLSRKQTCLRRAADPLKIRLAGETTHKPPDPFWAMGVGAHDGLE